MDGDIQLVDGETEWKGKLEVCFDQRWGTVSGEGWDSADTEVVCRELGYQSTGMYCEVLILQMPSLHALSTDGCVCHK